MASQNTGDDKVFNLQLLVQKLEEELTLYRNGTSVSELIEVIHEKDIEIETLRAKHDEKEDKLRRLAKTSGDVLLKYESMQQQLLEVHDILQNEADRVKQLEELVRRHADSDLKYQHDIQGMKSLVEQRDDEIGALRLTIWEHEQQTQQQAASSKSDIASLQTEFEAKYESLQSDVRRLENDVTQKQYSIDALTQEMKHWKAIAQEQEQSIESLQKRCAMLVKDKTERLAKLDEERKEMIAQVQQFRDTTTTNLRQREEMVQRKDDKIRELTFQINILQQEIRLKNQRISQGFGSSGKEELSRSASLSTLPLPRRSRDIQSSSTTSGSSAHAIPAAMATENISPDITNSLESSSADGNGNGKPLPMPTASAEPALHASNSNSSRESRRVMDYSSSSSTSEAPR